MNKKIKRFISVAAMLLFANISLAYDFSAVSNGTTFYYNITSNTAPYTVAVTNSGSNSYYSGSVTIPASVTYNGITYSVTSIGNNAFSGCSRLSTVTIPNSVTSIGDVAFWGCRGLTSITIPDSVRNIGGYVFYGCTGLTSVTIGNSVTNIGEYAFDGDTNLVTINFNADSCVCVNNGLSVFSDCNNLRTLNIGNNVKYILNYAFAGCTGLTSVTIGDSVTSIGFGAFYGCTGLTTVTIGNSVTSIGFEAFYGCTGLTSVTIGNSVTTIVDNAFYGCTNLDTINFNADSCVYVYNYDGDYDYYLSVFSDCNNLSTLNIGNNVKFIPKYAFRGCSGLTSVTIGDSVRSIGDSAFLGCTGLTTVNFNADSCVYMGTPAFSGCNNLRTLNIGNNVKFISNYAFSGCSGLTSVTIGNSVKTIGNNAFSSCTGLTRTNYTGTIAQWCDIDFGYFYANPIEFSRNLYINNQLVTNLVIPNTVNTIKSHAFYGDTCITSVTIPNSVTSIREDAFYECTGLRLTNYSGTVGQWCDIDFIDNPIYYSHNLYINNQLVTNLVIPNTVDTIKPYAFCGDTCITSAFIPNSVTCIGDLAFDSCTNLTSVTIPNSVTSIGVGAFAYCTGLTSLTIGDSVTSIGLLAFYSNTNLVTINYNADSCVFDVYLEDDLFPVFSGCNNLRTLNIGNNVKFIPNCAFNGCRYMDTIVFKGQNPPSTGAGCFNGVPRLTLIIVPCGRSAIYRDSLSTWFSNIVEDCGNSISEAKDEVDVVLQSSHGQIVIDGLIAERVFVADVVGRMLYNATVTGRTSIAVPNSGVYFVKVGTRPARKVVVVK